MSSVLNRLEEASECQPGDENGPHFESFRQHMFNQQENTTFAAVNTQEVLNIIQVTKLISCIFKYKKGSDH